MKNGCGGDLAIAIEAKQMRAAKVMTIHTLPWRTLLHRLAALTITLTTPPKKWVNHRGGFDPLDQYKPRVPANQKPAQHLPRQDGRALEPNIYFSFAVVALCWDNF